MIKGPLLLIFSAVSVAANNNAEAMFTPVVNIMRRYYGEFAPALLASQYD